MSPAPSPLPPGYLVETVLSDRPGSRVLVARRGEERLLLRLEAEGPRSQTETELAVLAALRHPGLARLVDFGRLPGPPPVAWLAREWIEGTDLLAWSRGRPAAELGRAVARLCPALEHLHASGFVHADLKPENALVAADGRVVLTDFGLARRAGSVHAAASGSLLGLAPEVLAGGPATPAADLFALGALLHRLLAPDRASARAFYARFPARSFLDAAGTPPELLPEWARDLVATLTARDPARRPRSAARVGATLAGRLGLDGLEADPPRLAWSAEEGRERWLRSLLPRLEERGRDEPLPWLRVPAGESPAPLAERLRISAALAGRGGAGVDLARELESVRDGLALDRWASALAEALAGWVVTVVPEGPEAAWPERAARALARALEQRAGAAGPPVRLVAVASAAAPGGWEELAVPPVTADAIETFLAAHLAGEPRARVALLARALAERGGGSATRVDLLLEEACASGRLLRAEHGFALRPGAIEVPPPAAGDHAAALPAEERRLASALWLCGGAASAEELAQTTQLPPARFARALRGLCERGRALARPDPAGLVLSARGPLAPDPRLLAALHRRRAQALAARAGAEALARAHAWAADPAPPTLAALTAALEEERRRGCPERALETLERLEAWLRAAGAALDPALAVERAEAWCDLGRYEQAHAALVALASTGEPGARARAELALARVAGRRHLPEEARAHLERALALDECTRELVLVGELRLLHAAGKDEEVLARAGELPAEGSALPARERAFAASLAAMSAFRLGRVDEARARTRRLVLEAARDADAAREAALWINLATIERRAGSHDDARAGLERAVALYEEAGLVAGLAHARAALGGLLREAGDCLRAAELLGAALAARERLGDREDAAATRGMLGLVAFERGHAREAIETLAAGARALRGGERLRFAPLLLAHADEMRARLGERPPAALEGEVEPDPRVLVSRARAAALCGRAERALELATRAERLALSLGQDRSAAHAQALAALVAGERPEVAPERCDALLWSDLRLRELLSGRGDAFDAEALRALAERLEEGGRDDRAARAWSALAARGPEPLASAARAERALARCAAGLSAGEAAALRSTLLGLPDPWPGDFAGRPGPDPRLEQEMEVASVLEINQRLLRQEDLPGLLGEIVEQAMRLTGAERGFLLLEEQGVLRHDLARDATGGEVPRPELEISRSVVDEALARGSVLRVSNAVDDPLLGHTASVVALELRSILCFPFPVREGVRGAIYLDHRLRTGAFDERAERLVAMFASQAALAIQQVQRLSEIRRLNRELERRVAEKESDLLTARSALRGAGQPVPPGGMIGDSEAMRAVHRFLERAAPSAVPVLVAGESGTGKELAARSLHELSPRRARPFVSESCAAIPASLIESELFGAVRGAYTGADQDRAGLFERAEGGTLFLDEVGELPLELQAKLLRVLETGEVRRLGAASARAVDFRLVAASNRDLEREVAEGRFRADLYYRLDGLRLTMPTLAERPEDVEPLVRHFLRLQEAEGGVPRAISRAVLRRLCERPWPGNVRELRNEVARLCVLCEGDLDDPALVREPAQAGAAAFPPGGVVPLAELERAAIRNALAHAGGDKRRAAELLGISRATIYKRIKEWEDGGSDASA